MYARLAVRRRGPAVDGDDEDAQRVHGLGCHLAGVAEGARVGGGELLRVRAVRLRRDLERLQARGQRYVSRLRSCAVGEGQCEAQDTACGV